MEKEKNLLEATKDYLVKRLENGTITAQEIAVIPQILGLEIIKKRRLKAVSNHYYSFRKG